MLDRHGFRFNIGILLLNQDNKLLWAKRVNQLGWQFPQGGLQQGENMLDAVARELLEEVGIDFNKTELLGQTKQWLRYRLPDKLIRKAQPTCIGQKQKWFLLRFLGTDADICLDYHHKPEFDQWQWVSYWYPIRHVITFKKNVYRQALTELSPLVFY